MSTIEVWLVICNSCGCEARCKSSPDDTPSEPATLPVGWQRDPRDTGPKMHYCPSCVERREAPSAVHSYRALMNELLRLRDGGGEIPQEVESSYAQKLDDLWWQMSEQEQATCEAEFSSATA
jgi:hypothetical protein